MAPVDGFDFLPFSANQAFLPSVSLAERVVNSLDDDDFELLLRSVDLVVLSQVFTEAAFERALDLSSVVAAQMTGMLVQLEILSAEEMAGARVVLTDMRDLSLTLLRLNEARTEWRAAA
jgi:hypothetical protein